MGIANRVPDSRTPRRFSSVTTTIMPTVRATRCWPNHGMADAMFAEAADIDTATVRT